MTHRTIKACIKDNRIPMHLSNFMHSNNGHEDAKRKFIELINRCPMDAQKISRALNSNPDTYGKYEPYRFFNNEHQIVIKQTNFCGNECLIYIKEEA